MTEFIGKTAINGIFSKNNEETLHIGSVFYRDYIKALKEARAQGDLSENAEYDAAKEAQGLLELKISKMKQLIANARTLDETKIDTSKILLYSKKSP